MNKKTAPQQPPRSDSASPCALTPRGADDRGHHNVDNEGPERTLQAIDRQEQWDAVAREPGYQSGDKGGYKGSVDEGKFEPQYRQLHRSGSERATREKAGMNNPADDNKTMPGKSNPKS